jgi:zinc/manganese transport system substrate-binding protein
MKKLLQSILAISAAAMLAAMPQTSRADDKLPVAASFSILGDLVRVVGADRVNVFTLVGPNQDAHVFEPKPSDAKSLLQSKLLVVNGLGFEPWALRLAKSAGYKGKLLVASDGVATRKRQLEGPALATLAKNNGHNHTSVEADPHAWQNPQNVVIYVRNITAALSQLDPGGANTFKTNSEAYIKELQALDTWAKLQFSALPKDKRKVITSHDAFGYFADHYGITFMAPQGMSTEAEPSAKQVARLIRQIQQEKIRAVFVENMSNPKLLAQLSRDAGVSVGTSLYADALSAPDQPGATYLTMMRHNVTQLALGMQRN